MVKVFISHQLSDVVVATAVARRLRFEHNIECYLDVIDPYIDRSGEDLADHIRVEMSKCTQLLAVVSYATKQSQWVPWEIGVAAEKDFPLATYSDTIVPPPEFLMKWPYLRNNRDLDQYAAASKAAGRSFTQKRATLNEQAAKRGSTREFFTNLRASLGQ